MYCPNTACPSARKGKPRKFRAGTMTCSKCGSLLVSAPPAVDEIAPTEKARLVPCITLPEISLVPHVKAILEAEGIHYYVKNETMHNLLNPSTWFGGHNFLLSGPVVMVDSSKLERARAALSALVQEAGPDPDYERDRFRPPMSGNLTCERCRQSLELEEDESFLTHCYYCGWPLPA